MSRTADLAQSDSAVRDFVLNGEISEAEINSNAASGSKWFSLRRLRFGFSISLSTNGYIVFPKWLGGLVIQWGELASTGNDLDVTFPIAFPTACRQVVATPIGALSSTQLVACTVVGVATTYFGLRPRYVTNGGTVGIATQGVRYLAIGN